MNRRETPETIDRASTGATGQGCDNGLRCVDSRPAGALHLRLSVGEEGTRGNSPR